MKVKRKRWPQQQSAVHGELQARVQGGMAASIRVPRAWAAFFACTLPGVVSRAITSSIDTDYMHDPSHLLNDEERAAAWHDSTLAKVNTALQIMQKSVDTAKASVGKQQAVSDALAPLVAAAEASEAKAKALVLDAKKVAESSKEEAAAKAKAKAEGAVKAIRAAGEAWYKEQESALAEKQELAKKSAGPPQTSKSDYAKYLQGMADRASEVASTYSGMAVQQMTDAKKLLRKARFEAERASKREVPNPEGAMVWAHRTLAEANAKKSQAQRYYKVAESVANAQPAWQQAADNEA
ncbi:unnamed protein product [Amoebophrya sp. A120]|nr:unnamed protein product [Amoebophrya sp. A120]|eukprot:GSA120T00005055001.1